MTKAKDGKRPVITKIANTERYHIPMETSYKEKEEAKSQLETAQKDKQKSWYLQSGIIISGTSDSGGDFSNQSNEIGKNPCKQMAQRT